MPQGLSLLEASLRNGVPHAHVCGGPGRCSTCRIRILYDLRNLPPMSAAERTVLERAGAGVGVRLACQLRPIRDIAFARPCFLRTQRWRRSNRSWPAGAGDERYLVVMFVDMPGSTRLAKGRLPFDTVFVINQFLNAVSRAVVAVDGWPNQCWRMGCSPYLGSQGFQRKLVGRRSSRLR